MLGEMSDCWSGFQHKHTQKLAPCGTPSFPEGYVMHGNASAGFKHWTLQKLGWHKTQRMPDLKPSMGGSTLHSASVVAVVSERKGEKHFSLYQNPIAQPGRARRGQISTTCTKGIDQHCMHKVCHRCIKKPRLIMLASIAPQALD